MASSLTAYIHEAYSDSHCDIILTPYDKKILKLLQSIFIRIHVTIHFILRGTLVEMVMGVTSSVIAKVVIN